MPQIITQVDAFTDKPFSGNPAGVCILKQPAEKEWMQKVALEMNLAETAFLYPQDDGYNLRWFTPAVEVDLCGHATLASAHVLWEEGPLPANQQARFYSRSGLLTAQRQGNWIELDFPALTQQPAVNPEKLIEALGARPTYTGLSSIGYLVELESEEAVRNLKPNLNLIAAIPTGCIMVTSQASTPGFDFVSRYFAPGFGINEDPVTGSAHCCLGVYWSKRLGREEFLAYQVSARGGVVRVEVAGKRVKLGGQAVTMLRGELL
jgi:PhzF family phenazine biosynthesis protein